MKNLNNEIDKKNKTNYKKVFFSVILFCVCVIPMFADNSSGITQVDNFANKIMTFMQADWVKVLLILALVAEAIGMIMAGKQGGGAEGLKKFVPWLIGTIILLSASSILTWFIGDGGLANSIKI